MLHAFTLSAAHPPPAVNHFLYIQVISVVAPLDLGQSLTVHVQEMINRGLVEPARLLELFSRVEEQLYKYPAIDARSLRQAVEQVVSDSETSE